jgi:hypothetical protein
MMLSSLLVAAYLLCSSGIQAAPSQRQQVLSDAPFRIPTPYESAVMARRIYHLSSLAVISTTFPTESSSHSAARPPPPENLGGIPFGLAEYYNPNCSHLYDKTDLGNPLIIAVEIATYVKNAKAGSNMTLTLRWKPPNVDSKTSQLMTPAALPRFVLIGHMEALETAKECSEKESKAFCETQAKSLNQCFTQAHPDARLWLPGNDIHESYFARLVVDSIYWFGGFGDRAYIGWIDINDWRNIKQSEWESIRLPGE